MFAYFHCFNSVKNKSSNTYYISDVVNIYFTMDASSFKGSKRHTGFRGTTSQLTLYISLRKVYFGLIYIKYFQ